MSSPAPTGRSSAMSRTSMGGTRRTKKMQTVKSMGELNVEGRQNAWKETGNGKPATDVTNPTLAGARPVLGKTRLGAVTEASSMVQAPSAEFLQKNVWHNNVNDGILSTVQPGVRMDFRRRKSDVTRC